jgi:hypothetical protein
LSDDIWRLQQLEGRKEKPRLTFKGSLSDIFGTLKEKGIFTGDKGK